MIIFEFQLLIPDFDVDIDSGLDFEIGDVGDRVGGTLNLENSTMDSHLIGVIGVCT